MKKILFLSAILISFCTSAQIQNPLDTISVNLQLRKFEWFFLAGNYDRKNKDSLTAKAWRKIDSSLTTIANQGLMTQLTVNSLPGGLVVEFYDIAETRTSAGKKRNMGDNIHDKIFAIGALAYWIGRIDQYSTNSFNEDVKEGRWWSNQ